MSSAIATVLSKVQGFTAMNESQLEIIAQIAHPKKSPANTQIVHEGDQSDELYIIAAGQVSIDFQSYRGNTINICRIGEQQLFGELAYLDHQPRSASATTTIESKIFILKREDLDKCFNDNPDIGYLFMHDLAQLVTRKLRYTNLALKDKAA